ncbi:MAG: lysophospholipid acyltransferase family protein [Thermodesulfobacteriota bacterium]
MINDAPCLRRQYRLGRLAVFAAAPLIFLAVKLAGYRVRELVRIRREIKQMMQRHSGPWLIWSNHLTMIDSVILAYAMFPVYRYMFQYRLLPWNVPEDTNFNRNPLVALLCYLLKCIPVRRGGDRKSVRQSMEKVAHLLASGQSLMIFPEGTRARTGRISSENGTYHVGRLFRQVPGIRVMCVYLRGDRQDSYSNFPKFGENFTMAVSQCIPHTRSVGLRANRECARQIIDHLLTMESAYFDSCGQRRRGSVPSGDKRQGRQHPVYLPGVAPGRAGKGF